MIRSITEKLFISETVAKTHTEVLMVYCFMGDIVRIHQEIRKVIVVELCVNL